MFINKIFRRKLLVDKKFQTSFIFIMLITLVIIVLILSILIIYSTSQKITGSVYTKIVNLKNTNELIIPIVIKISLLILVICGGFIAYNLLKYTNKIVGPLVRFKRSLKNIGDGDFTEYIKFRDNDKLRDLGDILSASTKRLNSKAKTLKEHFDIISKLIKDKEIKKLDNKEIKQLKNSIDTIEFVLKNFKTN